MGQIGRSLRVGRLEFCSSNLDVWEATLADFVLGGLSFWGENPRSCTWQWWLPSRFLVEGIVWRLDLLQGENPGSNYDGWTGRR